MCSAHTDGGVYASTSGPEPLPPLQKFEEICTINVMPLPSLVTIEIGDSSGDS
jgi:hypothetical protein